MINRKTTLVLGAGASTAFNYPTGGEVRTALTGLGSTSPSGMETLIGSPNQVRQFSLAFQESQMYSIDAFLARRMEFAEIGKRAIAALLLSNESVANLTRGNPDDSWCRYLFNAISTDTWDGLSFRNLSVVTFNYDCSFETFMLFSLMAAYNKSTEEAVAKLRELKIVHVYGSLGGALPGDDNHLAYGLGPSMNRVTAAAKQIKVVPEGRDDNSSFDQARKLLLEADAIAFLGFGFDRINLLRLQSNVTCTSSLSLDSGSRKKRPVVATVLGMIGAEINTAAVLIGHTYYETDGTAFVNANCLTALRSTQILR